MDTETQIYRDLQKNLDKLPSGFPATESGADIRLLKQFFTPEEAKVGAQLSMKPEPIKRIYSRVKKSGMSIEELQQILDRMAYKGTLLVNEEGYNEKHYSNVRLHAGGTYNFQVNRLNKDLIDTYRQYVDESREMQAGGRYVRGSLPLRTIPIEKSIPLPEKYRVSHYDDVRKLIETRMSGKKKIRKNTKKGKSSFKVSLSVNQLKKSFRQTIKKQEKYIEKCQRLESTVSLCPLLRLGF